MIVGGCASSSVHPAVPPNLDRSTILLQAVQITAKDFDFEPSVLRVKAGTLVRFKIKSIDGTHGFRLSDFGIDERLDENVEKIVDVYFPSAGEYGFRCSHFCGIGHFWMAGKIIVE